MDEKYEISQEIINFSLQEFQIWRIKIDDYFKTK